MELEIKEQSRNRLVLELKGGDVTLANALRQELWNDKDIKNAGTHVPHPLVGIPRLIVETNGKKSPKQALQSAVQRLRKMSDKLGKEASKAF
jgi:DNA-directed RNA polymerase subunit L